MPGCLFCLRSAVTFCGWFITRSLYRTPFWLRTLPFTFVTLRFTFVVRTFAVGSVTLRSLLRLPLPFAVAALRYATFYGFWFFPRLPLRYVVRVRCWFATRIAVQFAPYTVLRFATPTLRLPLHAGSLHTATLPVSSTAVTRTYLYHTTLTAAACLYPHLAYAFLVTVTATVTFVRAAVLTRLVYTCALLRFLTLPRTHGYRLYTLCTRDGLFCRSAVTRRTPGLHGSCRPYRTVCIWFAALPHTAVLLRFTCWLFYSSVRLRLLGSAAVTFSVAVCACHAFWIRGSAWFVLPLPRSRLRYAGYRFTAYIFFFFGCYHTPLPRSTLLPPFCLRFALPCGWLLRVCHGCQFYAVLAVHTLVHGYHILVLPRSAFTPSHTYDYTTTPPHTVLCRFVAILLPGSTIVHLPYVPLQFIRLVRTRSIWIALLLHRRTHHLPLQHACGYLWLPLPVAVPGYVCLPVRFTYTYTVYGCTLLRITVTPATHHRSCLLVTYTAHGYHTLPVHAVPQFTVTVTVQFVTFPFYALHGLFFAVGCDCYLLPAVGYRSRDRCLPGSLVTHYATGSGCTVQLPVGCAGLDFARCDLRCYGYVTAFYAFCLHVAVLPVHGSYG